jgi:8-oxo-dGTP pyrophosphatase MutT (NUDIX family)
VVTVRDAATVMLVRDHEVSGDLEVFMQQRHPDAVFGPGAHVFPGGAVDLEDAESAVVGRDADLTDRLMTRGGSLRWWVAAAREAFEEAGFLLTEPAPSGDLAAERLALNRRERSWRSILEEHALAVAADQMFLFSHWLTPSGPPRRYDTWFFVAAAPPGQQGAHDNEEAVQSEWVRPVDALVRWNADDIDLIFPTMRSLQMLARFESTASLLDAVARADRLARKVESAPFVVDDGSGERLALFPSDMSNARRGWRALGERPGVDLAIQAADRAAIDEGVA